MLVHIPLVASLLRTTCICGTRPIRQTNWQMKWPIDRHTEKQMGRSTVFYWALVVQSASCSVLCYFAGCAQLSDNREWCGESDWLLPVYVHLWSQASKDLLSYQVVCTWGPHRWLSLYEIRCVVIWSVHYIICYREDVSASHSTWWHYMYARVIPPFNVGYIGFWMCNTIIQCEK